jgi:hypothetical protein
MINEMTDADYQRLLKLIEMLSSDSDGEVLNAVTMISRILNGYGLAWSDLIMPRRLLPTRASAAEDLIPDVDSNETPPPIAEATPKVMYRFLMDSPNLTPDAKRDVRRHSAAIKNGNITPAIRGELQTMYVYAILNGKKI